MTTEKKQALQGSRLNAFSMDPDDLVIITDPAHPLYDARVELPLNEAMVVNIMALGVLKPVLVRKMDDKPVVIDGRQRTKAAREANKRLRAAGKDEIRVPTIVRRGDEADAYTVTVSANKFSQQDSVREDAEKAQRLAQLGRGEGDIALALGVSISTVKRYLDMNTKKRAPRAPRAKSTRPNLKTLREWSEDNSAFLTSRERALLDWVLGKIGTADLDEAIDAKEAA